MCKALDCSGAGSDTTVAACLLAIDSDMGNAPNAIYTVSLSINGPPSSAMSTAVATMLASFHVSIFAAAGNADVDACGTAPAGITGVRAIAASTITDTAASFSNFGSCVWMYAPGVNVISAAPNAQYAEWSGTSASCPIVAGAHSVVAGQVALTFNPGSGNGAQLVEESLMDQASHVGLPQPLLFVAYDASITNDYGLPPPPPPPPPPTSPTPSSPTTAGPAGATPSPAPQPPPPPPPPPALNEPNIAPFSAPQFKQNDGGIVSPTIAQLFALLGAVLFHYVARN
jgi:hypothetical protein